MAEELSLDNILTSSEVDNLFIDNDPEHKEDTSKEESTESIEETNTTDTSNDVKEETEEYKWAAIQPGSTKTSDGVTVSWKYVGITK